MTAATAERGHVESMSVHFDDLDAMGMVHNARYAVLLERAMLAFWARHGFGYSDQPSAGSDGFAAVAEYAIIYRAPIRGVGEVRVHFWIERLGRSSAEYRFRILSADGGTVHAEGRRVHIKLDPGTLRPAPWTAEGTAVATRLL